MFLPCSLVNIVGSICDREEASSASGRQGSNSNPVSGGQLFHFYYQYSQDKATNMFLPHPRVKVSIVGSLRDREVACSASNRQGLNFESCVWRTLSSQSSHHPQEVLLAQFSLYVHKGDLKPDSFHLFTGQ